MENENIGPMLSRVYFAIRQQAEGLQTLTLGLRATMEVLKKQYPKFEQEYADQYAVLQSGELGKKFAQDLAAFDQVLGVMKSGKF